MRRSQSESANAVILMGLFIVGCLIKPTIDWLMTHPFLSACITVSIAGFVGLKVWKRQTARDETA